MKTNVKTRAKVVKAYLDKLYASPVTELNYNSEFELLIAVILSAQCTDVRVNKVTNILFKTHNTAQDFVAISQQELEKQIYSCGFYKQKAMSIKQASKDIVEKFNGKVPNTLEDLMSLRGVGRKTANVILSVAFGVPAIAVDTHVFRVARRLGLSSGKTVWEVEQDLMKLFKKEDWIKLHYQLVLYGRYHSKARGDNKWEEKFLEFEKKFLEQNKK